MFYSCVLLIGKPFHFRRCGWPQNKELIWLLNDKKWIVAVNNLFTMAFGEDFLAYEWHKIKRSATISPESIPAFNYDHALWASALNSLCTSAQSNLSIGTPILTTSPSPKSVSTTKPDLNIPQMPLSNSSITSSSSTAVVSPQPLYFVLISYYLK